MAKSSSLSERKDELISAYYFCRVHKTIKKAPAMAAGITDRVWTIADLLA